MAQMKYYYELTVSSSPHVHQEATTKTLMRDVIIALMPALVFSVYNFGIRALTMTLVSVLSCYGFEKLWNILMKQHDKTYDLSACVTGVLLEVRESNLPAQNCYARAGFTPVGRRKGYYDLPKEDALLMGRQLL